MVMSKKKGNRVEREIAKILKGRFNLEFCRVPQSGAVATVKKNTSLREDAKEILSGDIITPENFRFSIEVKSRKGFSFFDFFSEKSELKSWLKQAEEESEISNKFPLLIVKINYQPIFVMFKASRNFSEFLYNSWQIMLIEDFLSLADNVFLDWFYLTKINYYAMIKEKRKNGRRN